MDFNSMKICYDTLENIKLTISGNFTSSSHYYIELEECAVCKESYLGDKYNPSVFCSASCAKKGKNNPAYKKALREGFKEKKKKEKKPLVYSLGLVSYDTYIDRISTTDNARLHIDDEGRRLLETRCSKCNEWFIPKRDAIQDRIRAVEGRCAGECRLYCSKECKNNCDVYYKKYTDYLIIDKIEDINKVYTNYELRVWSNEVLKRADNKCMYCGELANHAHHIEPKKLEPGLALDPDNGLACCIKCHYKYGHKDECSTWSLAQRRCNDRNN